MANMTFGVNIIPKDNTLSLGTSQNKWKINGVDDPKLTDTTYSNATTSSAGLMSSTDKTKLDGIATGAQVNSITGVKGDAESSYRTGNINITSTNIGAMKNPDYNSAVYTTGNLNDASAGVAFWSSDCTNAPFTFWSSVLTIVPLENYKQQIAFPYSDNDSGTIAYRNFDNGTWGTWKYATLGVDAANLRSRLGITPANIGAVSKSGDTMTGALTAQSISVKADLPLYYLRDENNLDYAHMRGNNTDHHIIFRMTTPGGNPQLFEDYNLPNPTIQSGPVGYDILTTKSAVGVPQGGTGATTAAGARTNLGIATTVTTITTTGITSNGNWISDLEPNKVVIDAAYCTAGSVAVTPYCYSGGKWAFYCIDVSTGAAYGTAFDLTIRYHNIY